MLHEIGNPKNDKIAKLSTSWPLVRASTWLYLVSITAGKLKMEDDLTFLLIEDEESEW